MVTIYPAIMGADSFEIEKLGLLKSDVRRVHVDIMDNIFVPNSTSGSDLVNDFARTTDYSIWAHLMVDQPLVFYQKLTLCEGSIISFHIESRVKIFEMINTIKEKKHRSSIALRPKTPISDAYCFLNAIDQVLIMSVEPGFSGQCFLAGAVKKLEELAAYRKKNNCMFRIAMDGGINKDNIALLAKIGVDDCAVSSGIFGQEDPVDALRMLYNIANTE